MAKSPLCPLGSEITSSKCFMAFKYSRLLIYLEGFRTYSNIYLAEHGKCKLGPQNNYTVMVHFPQITLREWIQPFSEMKLIKCTQSGESVSRGVHIRVADCSCVLLDVHDISFCCPINYSNLQTSIKESSLSTLALFRDP